MEIKTRIGIKHYSYLILFIITTTIIHFILQVFTFRIVFITFLALIRKIFLGTELFNILTCSRIPPDLIHLCFAGPGNIHIGSPADFKMKHW